MVTIPTRHGWEIWSMDRPWKLKVLQRTTQTQWLTSKIVSETIRLRLYPMTYLRKDKYESRYIV